MADRYRNFAALAATEVEGRDYQIVIKPRASNVAIIAPHGGKIEPTTSELARAIAGDDHSFYCLEGLRNGAGELHITSENFDEPKGRALVGASELVVAIHGRKDDGDQKTVWLGGLDMSLVDAVGTALREAGYAAKVAGGRLEGRAPGNICNAGKRHGGVQLELPRTLRDDLRDNPKQLGAFAGAVRKAVARVVGASAK